MLHELASRSCPMIAHSLAPTPQPNVSTHQGADLSQVVSTCHGHPSHLRDSQPGHSLQGTPPPTPPSAAP